MITYAKLVCFSEEIEMKYSIDAVEKLPETVEATTHHTMTCKKFTETEVVSEDHNSALVV